ncbi:MAG TPA: NAD(P)H-binding protein, partial [Nocardioidaceae bacterium]|nr:NAD(P)H-binding protein [Nocardioidaceae bacterium]
MQLLIAGGTGTSGRVLARRAAAAGHHPRVLTRGPSQSPRDGQHLVQGDLTTGAGLDEAVVGVDAVIDLSNISTARYQPAAAFFTTATDHLFAAEQRAGVTHHLTLSIVGVDRFPSPYYRAKLDQEATVTAASARTGVGYSIVRVTQFYDFAALILQRFRFRRFVLAPPLHSQPVHLDDVADHLL